MGRFDRYIVKQLLVLFGLFSLILVSLYWINRAVILFDQLIANGHSALVFLEFTSLSLPNLVRIVLPIAGIVAVIWGVNRLSGDSELVIAKATGFSPWRMARPVLYFGLILAALLALLAHWIVPMAESRLTQREAEISRDLTARFLREGEFLHPTRKMTFFVTKIDPETGLMQDVMLSDASSEDREVTYTARRAVLRRSGEEAQIIMLDGMAQSLNLETNALSLTYFEDLVYDISGVLSSRRTPRTRPAELTSAELIFDEAARAAPNKQDENLLMHVHARVAEVLMAPLALLVVFAALNIGSFSRFGMWRQISFGIGATIAIKAVDNYLIAAVRKSPQDWPLLYLAAVLCAGLALLLLWVASRNFRIVRRNRVGVSA